MIHDNACDPHNAYDPRDWFWIVAGDDSRAWSSAECAYVGEWPAGRVTRIASESELTEVLQQHRIRGPVVRETDVTTERERRLALGFDYDFGDSRGVHRIGTTKADLQGWDEVTKAAQAAINLGVPSTSFNIVTDTGAAVVTALEWQSILTAGAQFRQPIWAASFALLAATPIPMDFTMDSHWTQ